MTYASLAWLVTWQTDKKARNIARADIPCGWMWHYFFRDSNFYDFLRFFHDPQKVPAEKNNSRKNLLHCRNLYTNIAIYMSCNIMLVPIYLNRLFHSTNKTKLEAKHSEIKRWNCSRHNTSIKLLKALKKRIVWRYSID